MVKQLYIYNVDIRWHRHTTPHVHLHMIRLFWLLLANVNNVKCASSIFAHVQVDECDCQKIIYLFSYLRYGDKNTRTTHVNISGRQFEFDGNYRIIEPDHNHAFFQWFWWLEYMFPILYFCSSTQFRPSFPRCSFSMEIHYHWMSSSTRTNILS